MHGHLTLVAMLSEGRSRLGTIRTIGTKAKIRTIKTIETDDEDDDHHGTIRFIETIATLETMRTIWTIGMMAATMTSVERRDIRLDLARDVSCESSRELAR